MVKRSERLIQASNGQAGTGHIRPFWAPGSGEGKQEPGVPQWWVDTSSDSKNTPPVAGLPGPLGSRPKIASHGWARLSMAYAEALTARFLKAREARNAHLGGLLVMGIVDYLVGHCGVRVTAARVEDVGRFLFEALPQMGWLSVLEVPAALAELRAFWRFLARVDGASRRLELQRFLSHRSTADVLADHVRSGIDDTVDMAPF